MESAPAANSVFYPSPLWAPCGEGRREAPGWGSCGNARLSPRNNDPTPNPSPQGVGEETECAALLCVKSNGTRSNLAFLRRPTIGFGARAAHQHRSLTVA